MPRILLATTAIGIVGAMSAAGALGALGTFGAVCCALRCLTRRRLIA